MAPPLPLAGKAALVIGGSRGIGRATAIELARCGARVAVGYVRNGPEARRTLATIQEKGILVRGDASTAAGAARMVREARRRLGRLDVLVCTAGYSTRRLWNAPLARIRARDWERAIAVELSAPFYLAQAAAKVLRPGGAIVLVGSSAAERGDPSLLAYSGAKTGVAGLTRALAAALAPRIRVNAIAPGSIATGWIRDWRLSKKDLAAIRKETPLRRMGTPGEAARAIRFLASDDASFITGAVLPVDGGASLG